MYTDIKAETCFEDSCRELGISSKIPAGFLKLPEHLQKSNILNYKLETCIKAINGGDEILYDGETEIWSPWFFVGSKKDKPAGSGFSFCNSYCVHASTYVSPRLGYKNKELSDYGAKVLFLLYREYYIGF